MEKVGEAELIGQMKAVLQTLASSSSYQNYGDMMLMRFLVARSMNPEKAAKMFVQWQEWRADFAPLGYIPDSEVQELLDFRAINLGGTTQGGHPLMIIRGSNHSPTKDRLKLKKFVVHILDKTLASANKGTEIGNQTLVAILDLQQISYKNVDARAFIIGLQIVQAYYPGVLQKCFILHAPRFFVSVWKMISMFLDKEILKRMIFVTKEEEMRSLGEQIGDEALPECYGGKAKLVAIQDVDVVMSPTPQI